MKKLHTIFLNSEGKKHTLQPKVFDEAISAEQVRQGMASIARWGFLKAMTFSITQKCQGQRS